VKNDAARVKDPKTRRTEGRTKTGEGERDNRETSHESHGTKVTYPRTQSRIPKWQTYNTGPSNRTAVNLREEHKNSTSPEFLFCSGDKTPAEIARVLKDLPHLIMGDPKGKRTLSSNTELTDQGMAGKKGNGAKKAAYVNFE